MGLHWKLLTVLSTWASPSLLTYPAWTKHINIISSEAKKLVGLLFWQFYRCADADIIRKLYIAIIRPHLEYASQVWDLHLLKDQQTLENIQKFACRVCLKQWDLSYPTMLRTLSIPTLAARRKQLKLCTFFSYVNGLSIAPNANLIHRVTPFQSRHVHDLSFVCPIARTNQYMYSFFPIQFICGTTYLILLYTLTP